MPIAAGLRPWGDYTPAAEMAWRLACPALERATPVKILTLLRLLFRGASELGTSFRFRDEHTLRRDVFDAVRRPGAPEPRELTRSFQPLHRNSEAGTEQQSDPLFAGWSRSNCVRVTYSHSMVPPTVTVCYNGVVVDDCRESMAGGLRTRESIGTIENGQAFHTKPHAPVQNPRATNR